jgi:hypothetical protein
MIHSTLYPSLARPWSGRWCGIVSGPLPQDPSNQPLNTPAVVTCWITSLGEHIATPDHPNLPRDFSIPETFSSPFYSRSLVASVRLQYLCVHARRIEADRDFYHLRADAVSCMLEGIRTDTVSYRDYLASIGNLVVAYVCCLAFCCLGGRAHTDSP